jgi:NTP pyrophosphatase (non-canonical NTP hydrolase)
VLRANQLDLPPLRGHRNRQRQPLGRASVTVTLCSSVFSWAKKSANYPRRFASTKKMRIGTTSITGTVDEELADVLIYLCAIANRLGISIDEALRKKEALNETRTWK